MQQQNQTKQKVHIVHWNIDLLSVIFSLKKQFQPPFDLIF